MKAHGPKIQTPLQSSAIERRVEIDMEKYLPYLEDRNISVADKMSLIETIFRIMGAFVELGYGVHPVQTGCGQNQDTSPKAAKPEEDLLECVELLLLENFESAARVNIDPAAGKAIS